MHSGYAHQVEHARLWGKKKKKRTETNLWGN
jgi:hypothetical protein